MNQRLLTRLHAQKEKTMKRDFLQSASTYHPAINVAGWFVSELVSGTRCFWDGGISRGLATEQVPWASINNPRTGRPKNNIMPLATGLWDKCGNPIKAHGDFLDMLPPFPCDGMLTDNYEYVVFSAPTWAKVLQSGEIHNDCMRVKIDWEYCDRWLHKMAKKESCSTSTGSNFSQELFVLQMWKGWTESVYIQLHVLLPQDIHFAKDTLHYFMKQAFESNAKGIVFRNPASMWEPFRTKSCLKLERS